MFTSVDEVRQDIVHRLGRAVKDRRSPMHTPVVGTADAQLRVMVLRAFSQTHWTLRFHTDARAPKCTTIANGAPVGVLFYDAAAKVQIRARGEGQILKAGEAVEAAWERSSNFARRCYLAEGPPGNAVDEATSGLPEWAEGIQPEDAQIAPARENFALLVIAIQSFDWLFLAHDGHRRAQMMRTNGEWSGSFVIP